MSGLYVGQTTLVNIEYTLSTILAEVDNENDRSKLKEEFSEVSANLEKLNKIIKELNE